MTIQQDFDDFVGGLSNAIKADVLYSKLPLGGDDLKSTASQVVQFLSDLQAQVDSVLQLISAGVSADSVIAAFSTANISGVTAAHDPSDSSKVLITLSEIPDKIIADLAALPLDFGNTAIGLDAEAAVKAIIQPRLDVSLSLDPSTGTFSLARARLLPRSASMSASQRPFRTATEVRHKPISAHWP